MYLHVYHIKFFSDLDMEKLVALTHEYQMTHITKHCEKYLLLLSPSIGRLVLAEKYGLTELRKVCLKFAMTKPLVELEQDEMYELVEPATKVKILNTEVRKQAERLKVLEDGMGRIKATTSGKEWYSGNCECKQHRRGSQMFGCHHCDRFLLQDVYNICQKIPQ